jgi:hypothetical protein
VESGSQQTASSAKSLLNQVLISNPSRKAAFPRAFDTQWVSRRPPVAHLRAHIRAISLRPISQVLISVLGVDCISNDKQRRASPGWGAGQGGCDPGRLQSNDGVEIGAGQGLIISHRDPIDVRHQQANWFGRLGGVHVSGWIASQLSPCNVCHRGSTWPPNPKRMAESS